MRRIVSLLILGICTLGVGNRNFAQSDPEKKERKKRLNKGEGGTGTSSVPKPERANPPAPKQPRTQMQDPQIAAERRRQQDEERRRRQEEDRRRRLEQRSLQQREQDSRRVLVNVVTHTYHLVECPGVTDTYQSMPLGAARDRGYRRVKCQGER